MDARLPTVVHALAAHAIDRPCALAFGFDEVGVSFADLAASAARVAAALVARGLARGERCALVLPTGPDFVRALFGALRAGLVPVAINHSAPRDLIARRVRLVRAAVAIAEDEAPFPGATTVAALIADGGGPAPAIAADPDDLAYLQITSGTSGEPKAAMVRHRNLVASMLASAEHLDFGPRDIFSSFVPLHHDLGLVRFVFKPVYLGCPAHLVPASVVGLRAWLTTIARTRATITGAPDFAYRIAARTVPPAGLDLGCLRYAGNGGEPARRSTIETFEARFGLHRVVQPGYGLAEATLGVCSARPGMPIRADDHGNVACGWPFPGLEVKLADSGEILARGPAIFAGYFDDETGTRAALRDGWLHTGDIGTIAADGQITVIARERALVKRGGALIAPREVEEAADRVAGVRLSAAVGLVRGGSEDLVVVAEVAPDLDASGRDALIAAVAEAVSRAVGFAPAEVRLVAPRTIPRTANGKLQHAELRRRISNGGSGSEGEVGQPEDPHLPGS